MSSRRPLRRRVVAGAALGAGAALAAGWAAQHRLATRTVVSDQDLEAEGLVLPDDVVHHVVEADDGGRIHVVERGRGTPLVLLHGFMLSSATWVHQFQDLADHHRVIAVDLRGHGQSEPGADGFSARRADRGAPRGAAVQPRSPGIRRMADDVRSVLEALDVEHAVVVGHSMGGMVALQLVPEMPSAELHRRVAGLVLVSTTAGPFSRVPGYARMARAAGPASSLALSLAGRAGVTALPAQDLRWWVTRTGFGADAPRPQIRFVERLHTSTAPATLAQLLPSLAMFDVSHAIGTVDVPVLVVVGSHDRLTPPRHARRMAAALAQAQLVELPRCGHMPMLERRREFSRLLDEFASKVG